MGTILILTFCLVSVVIASPCAIISGANPSTYSESETEITFTFNISGSRFELRAPSRPAECESTWSCNPVLPTLPTTCTCTVTSSNDDLGNNITASAEVQCNSQTTVGNATSFFVSTCGDQIVDTGEQCDDGNIENADGCSSECQREACTYSQGFWKNVDNPPMNTDPQNINATHCREGCTKLGMQCSSLDSPEPYAGACAELQDSCEKVCNDTGLYYELSYPKKKDDLCDHVAGQWFAAIMNFFWGGANHGFEPTGSPIPDSLVEALRDFNITLLCVDQCTETESNSDALFNMTDLLNDYNIGNIGPGHCDNPPDECCMSCFSDTQCGVIDFMITIDDGICSNFSCGAAASVMYNNSALPHVYELWSQTNCQGIVTRYSKHLCKTAALAKRQDGGVSWSGDPGECPAPPTSSSSQPVSRSSEPASSSSESSSSEPESSSSEPESSSSESSSSESSSSEPESSSSEPESSSSEPASSSSESSSSEPESSSSEPAPSTSTHPTSSVSSNPTPTPSTSASDSTRSAPAPSTMQNPTPSRKLFL